MTMPINKNQSKVITYQLKNPSKYGLHVDVNAKFQKIKIKTMNITAMRYLY